jgi:D-psicose/D-tagatose/L-ribulose 3-epimerase
MNLSVCTWGFGELPLESIFKVLHSAEVNGIELRAEPEKYNVDEVKILTQKYQIEISSLTGTFPGEKEKRDMAHPDPAERKKAVEYIKSSIDFAKKVGAKIINILPSPVGRIDSISNYNDEWRYSVETAREALKYAKNNKVELVVEPLNRYETFLINNFDQAIQYCHEVGPELGIMFDTYHANIEEEDMIVALTKLLQSGKLRHIHFADNNRQAPGRGNINFISILKLLKVFNYNGYIVLEAMAPGPNPFKAIKDESSLATITNYVNYFSKLLREIDNVLS